MLSPHARLKHFSSSEVPKDEVPIWVPVEAERSLAQERREKARRKREDKALAYNEPPPKITRRITHEFISSNVQRPLRENIKARKRDIASELLVGTNFSFLKFTSVYKPRRAPKTTVHVGLLQLEPYGRFVFANGDKY
ncbi:hypothetical protein BV898_20110, partial [Hypsibius exemplaris]